MDRLPRDPRNFRELIEADLRRAARLIIKVQDEIDPQFRIATPEGDYWIAVTLPADDYGRKVILRNLALFMAWKQALGFTLASELYEPDSIYCVGFMPKERHACLARIHRASKPWTAKNFGEGEWLPDKRTTRSKALSWRRRWWPAAASIPRWPAISHDRSGIQSSRVVWTPRCGSCCSRLCDQPRTSRSSARRFFASRVSWVPYWAIRRTLSSAARRS